MTSEDDGSSQRMRTAGYSVVTNKRRKLTRACDPCRRRKIKCDAPEKQEGEECTACALHARSCTFMEDAKKRGPPIGYVRYIENRVDCLEAALKLLAPTYDIEGNVGPRYTQTSWTTASHRDIPLSSIQPVQTNPPIASQTQTFQRTPVEAKFPKGHTSMINPDLAPETAGVSKPRVLGPVSRHTSHELDAPDSSSGEESFTRSGFFQLPQDDLPEQLSKLHLGKSTFLGKSSNVRLLHDAISLKNEITGRNDGTWPEVRGQVWGGINARLQPPQVLSPEGLRFPPQDLSDALISLYFQFFHPLFPTLHRPSFEAQLSEGMHEKHLAYGLQLLLICAIGSRWSGDPRVCGAPDTALPASTQVDWKLAGWPYFSQVIHFCRPFTYAPSLPDLQNSVLLGFYGLSSQVPHSAWLVAGQGVRYAIDLGAHRQKTYRQDHPLQNEIWKRTFWCLVNLDRLISGTLGRPTAVNDEDIDVDLPLNANDDSWDESHQLWKLNEKPSYMQYFIHSTKLHQILAYAKRTIYSPNRSSDPPNELQERVSELDSALNNWADNIPDHLQWDPNIADPVFFSQAVALNLSYRHAQISIHRRFLPGPNKKPSPLTFTSLAICTNAARTISHIADAHLKWILAGKHSPEPNQHYAVAIPPTPIVPFFAGVVLFISTWGAGMSGGNVDAAGLADDIQKILRYIEFSKDRNVVAGRLLEMLRELASVGDLPLDTGGGGPPARPATKRARSETDNVFMSAKVPPGATQTSLHHEPSPPGRPLPGEAVPCSSSIWAHRQSDSLQFADFLAAAQPHAVQIASGQKTDPGLVADLVATNVPSSASNLLPSTSGSGFPYSNSADTRASGSFATSTPPVVAAHPGPSTINGEVDVDAFATAAYFRPLEGWPDFSHGYSHQSSHTTGSNGIGGDYPQYANAWNSIPHRLQPASTDPLISSAGVEWESWISDIWGLYDAQSTIRRPLNPTDDGV